MLMRVVKDAAAGGGGGGGGALAFVDVHYQGFDFAYHGAYSFVSSDGVYFTSSHQGFRAYAVGESASAAASTEATATANGGGAAAAGAATVVVGGGLNLAGAATKNKNKKAIVKVGEFVVPGCAPHENVVGVLMTYDGSIAFATSAGRLGIVSRAAGDGALALRGDILTLPRAAHVAAEARGRARVSHFEPSGRVIATTDLVSLFATRVKPQETNLGF